MAVAVNAGARATAAALCATAVVWPAAAVVHVKSWRMLLAAHGSTADVAVGELRLRWKKKKGDDLQQVSSGMLRGWPKGLAGLGLDSQS